MTRRGYIPFAQWDAKGTVVGKVMDEGFTFPYGDWDVSADDWRGMFDRALRSLRARNVRAEAFEEFLEDNVPPRSAVDVDESTRALRRLPKRPRMEVEPSRVIVNC